MSGVALTLTIEGISMTWITGIDGPGKYPKGEYRLVNIRAVEGGYLTQQRIRDALHEVDHIGRPRLKREPRP